MNWNEDCDVLVIGSGGGGLVGALTAAKAGLKTIVVEATDRFGGTTAYSGGGMWLPCNAVLKRAGDDDTMDDARAYYRAVVGDRTPRAVQDAFLENGAGLIDVEETWLATCEPPTAVRVSKFAAYGHRHPFAGWKVWRIEIMMRAE